MQIIIVELVELYCKGIEVVSSSLEKDEVKFHNLMKVRDAGGFKVGDGFIEIEDDKIRINRADSGAASPQVNAGINPQGTN